jgi:hypothetical protein
MAALIVGAVVVYGVAFPSATVRYRVTLNAEVDGKLANGSGVIEVTYYKNLRLLGASADLLIGVKGEAISLAVGPREAVLVLLARGDHPRSSPEDIIPFLFGLTTGGIGSSDIPTVRKVSGSRELPLNMLPPLVLLRDTFDPKSAKFIKPDGLAIPSSRVVKLLRANIEIVSQGFWPLDFLGLSGVPVSRTIRGEIPWMDSGPDLDLFWRSLYATGFRPSGGSVEVPTLLVRGV